MIRAKIHPEVRQKYNRELQIGACILIKNVSFFWFFFVLFAKHLPTAHISHISWNFQVGFVSPSSDIHMLDIGANNVARLLGSGDDTPVEVNQLLDEDVCALEPYSRLTRAVEENNISETDDVWKVLLMWVRDFFYPKCKALAIGDIIKKVNTDLQPTL